MYDSFYGFSDRPFQLTPDARFWFESRTHRTAMSYLAYGLAQGEGFIVVTGEVGSGKTTLVGHVMESIDPARLTAARLVSTNVGPEDLLRLAADAFGLAPPAGGKAGVLATLEAFFHEEARAGRRVLLVVDEAQNLPVASLEELRMLSNFQLGNQPLVQLFLLGQPEFRSTVAHAPELEQLRQRVIANHHLDAMLPEEIEPYIIHRLSLVGWQENPVLAPSVYEEVYAATGGIPRRINLLLGRLLLFGAVEERHDLNGDDVAMVVEDLASAVAAPAPLAAAAAVAAAPTAAPSAVAPGAASAAAQTAVAPPATAAAAAARVLSMDPRTERQLAERGEQIALLQRRVNALEALTAEQDQAIRRVLGLLIDWAERDPTAPAVAHGRAA
jgi:general secretion pathway protein A